MDDPRYPAGPFSPKTAPLTAAEREEMIRRIAAHPERIRSAIAGLTEEQLDTPYRDGGWTVRQVVHHVVDSHMNSYVRFKTGLTEEKGTIRPYDEAAWAELPEAKSAPVALSLPLLEALHARWVVVLRGFSEDDFRRTLYHPEMDQELTLDTMLELYAWHCVHHEAHITALRERMGW